MIKIDNKSKFTIALFFALIVVSAFMIYNRTMVEHDYEIVEKNSN